MMSSSRRPGSTAFRKAPTLRLAGIDVQRTSQWPSGLVDKRVGRPASAYEPGQLARQLLRDFFVEPFRICAVFMWMGIQAPAFLTRDGIQRYKAGRASIFDVGMDLFGGALALAALPFTMPCAPIVTVPLLAISLPAARLDVHFRSQYFERALKTRLEGEVMTRHRKLTTGWTEYAARRGAPVTKRAQDQLRDDLMGGSRVDYQGGATARDYLLLARHCDYAFDVLVDNHHPDRRIPNVLAASADLMSSLTQSLETRRALVVLDAHDVVEVPGLSPNQQAYYAFLVQKRAGGESVVTALQQGLRAIMKG